MDCPRCGATNAGIVFCSKCRARLPGPAGAAPRAARAASSGGRNPAQTAALASLLAPGVGWILGVAFHSVRESTGGGPVLLFTYVGLLAVALAIGAIAAVTALVLSGRHGRKGVIGRALVGLVVCLVSVGFLASAFVTGLRRGQERKQLAAAMDATNQGLDKVLERATEGEFVQAEGAEALGRMGDLVRKSAETFSEPDRSIMLGLADASDRAAKLMRDKEAATRPFLDAGGIDPTNLHSVGPEERLVHARAALAAVDVYAKALRALPRDLEAALEARNVPGPRIAKTVQGYAAGANLDLVGEVTRTDREFLEAAVAMFELLVATRGTWQVENGTGTLIFRDTDAMERYNELGRKAKAAGEEQLRLQKDLLAKRRAAQAKKQAAR